MALKSNVTPLRGDNVAALKAQPAPNNQTLARYLQSINQVYPKNKYEYEIALQKFFDSMNENAEDIIVIGGKAIRLKTLYYMAGVSLGTSIITALILRKRKR